MDGASDTLILRVKGGRIEELVDQVATEMTFTLYLNGEFLVSLLCTPTELDSMAVGFLISEGFLMPHDQTLLSVKVDKDAASVSVSIDGSVENKKQLHRRKTISSGCGQGITFTGAQTLSKLPANRASLSISPELVQALLHDFKGISDLYATTGGVHSAALVDGNRISLFSEDLGRHNAVDKLIGKAFLAGIHMDDKILISSGRVSGEIMTKVIRSRIPILISRAAPTCMSVSYAEDHGITLIGFARGNRMNIYSHPWRVRGKD